jgi:hypothetical protein
MSTRSNIGIINTNGSVTAIYVHSDGYPSGVGKTLREHYNTEDAVRTLLSLGDLSVLGTVIGEKHDFDWGGEYGFDWDKRRADPRYKMCLAYGRDRGEKGTRARKYKTVKEACVELDNAYVYLFIVAENRWTFRDHEGPFEPLDADACERD